jgi:hypothetical protein
VTNPPDNPSAVPPADDPRQDSPTTPSAPAAGTRRAAWYRRLPGRLGIWIAAAALVAAFVIGCGGFLAGALVSHGFGERGSGESGNSRDGGWGHEGQRGGNGRDGGQNDREYGPGDGRSPKHERGRRGQTPTPTQPSSPSPTQSSTPAPTASPTS